jgi:putative ABC transport system permease protein
VTHFAFFLRNLTRRPGRSIFTILGVALAVTGFVLFYGLAEGMRQTARVSLDERGIHLIVTRRGTVEFFSSVLPEALVVDIRRIPGVADATSELAGLMALGDDHQALVVGWPPESFEWRSASIIRGRLPVSGRGEVLIGDLLAEGLGRGVGDEIELDWAKVRVAGITRFAATLNRGMVILPLADLQQMTMKPGRVTLVEVRLAAPEDASAVETVRSAIGRLRPDLAVSSSEDLLQHNKSLLTIRHAATALALLSLAIASLSVLNTMAMAVEERTREIGILAAIGWSRRRILAMIVAEGLMLAAAGGVLGGASGYLGNFVLSEFVLPGSGISAAAAFEIAMAAGVAALFIGVVGALWPAVRAAWLSPAAALNRQ